MPANAQAGNYKLKVEGMLDGGNGGYAFYNESDIDFDAKQASCFIQLSKPIFRQGQTGRGIDRTNFLPNLLLWKIILLCPRVI